MAGCYAGDLIHDGLSSLDAFAAEKISEVKVGVILPLTGPPAAMGIGGKQALETYFDHINAREGLSPWEARNSK